MGSPRDLQSDIAAFAAETVQAPIATGLIRTTAIDTQGFNRVSATLAPAAAVGASQVSYTWEESDDNSVWNDVPAIGNLPTRKQPDNLLEDPVAPYLQTIGVISEKRYLRIRFDSIVLAVALDIVVNQLAMAQQRPFQGNTSATLTDGKP